MRVKTYIKGFDEKLEGGFPQNSSILIFGSPGSGKTTFCNQFIYNGLKKGEAALYITFYAPPRVIKDRMKKFGWNIEGKIIIFIDVYSWKAGGIRVDKYTIREPSDLNEFNIKVSEAIKELKNKNLKRCTIDSLSTLFLYVPTDLALKFTSVLLGKFKLNDITQTIVIEGGVHDQATLNALDAMSDGCVELAYSEMLQKRIMRIRRMVNTKHSLEWFGFQISNKGIVME
ncbi:MAG: ATPase domain-containing protein [Candidatus Aenigmarchaeota archaeon]|nr:ATPase domain-containing protein [Candidatus Aenigmarchaeota archaeon]